MNASPADLLIVALAIFVALASLWLHRRNRP